jgi:hypothetical protein
MNKAEDHLKRAELCRKKAMAEANPESAEMWRQMAISYEDLARNVWIYGRLPGVEPAE